MNSYVTGGTIKTLREGRGLTQKSLADRIGVSDKAVSKWETGRGLPDLSLLEPLGEALRVSVAELLSGEQIVNRNRAGNPLRGRFYICPVCGNVLFAMGEAAIHCCGVALPPLEPEEPDEAHGFTVEEMDGGWYVEAGHPMEKGHYLTFLAQVSDFGAEITKLWPEQVPRASFLRRSGSVIYACCNRHGLFRVKT